MEKLIKPTLFAWLTGLALAIMSVFSSPVFADNTTPINLTTISQSGTLPAWRSSGVFVQILNKIYLWGGYVQCFTPGCTQAFPNALQVFDINTGAWSVAAGSPPPGRTWQSMDVWTDPQSVAHIIVYGGLEFQPDFSVFKSYADMWDFNTATNTWTQISTAATPGKRFGASFKVVAQKGYLFAGVEDLGGFNLVERNDLWTYDFATGVWTKVIDNDPAENPANQPGSRYRANFDYGPSLNSIVLFGGDRLVLPGQPDKPHRHDTWTLKLNPNPPQWEHKSDQVDPVVDPVSAVQGTKHVVGFGDLEPQDSSQRCCNSPVGTPGRFCDDAVKNIFNNPQINQAGSLYTKFVNVNGVTPLKRAAFVRNGSLLYIWGGYFLDCTAPHDLNSGVPTTNTTLRTLDLSTLQGVSLK